MPEPPNKTQQGDAAMSATWYYKTNEESTERGPVTFAELKALVTRGELVETHFVRRETEEEWSKAHTVIGLFADTGRPDGALTTDAAGAGTTAGASVQADAPSKPNPVAWWRRRVDRVELAALGLLLLWVAGVSGYYMWSTRPPRFPAPKRMQGTFTTNQVREQGAADWK